MNIGRRNALKWVSTVIKDQALLHHDGCSLCVRKSTPGQDLEARVSALEAQRQVIHDRA